MIEPMGMLRHNYTPIRKPASIVLFECLNLILVCSFISGSCHKRQKPLAPTPQAPIRNRQTRKVAIAKGLDRNTNLT